MRRRSISVSILLVLLMILSAGVVHASGGSDGRSQETTNDLTEKTKKHGKSGKVIELFGLQEPDESALITADGQVFPSTEPIPEEVVESPGDVFVYRERLFRLDDSDPDNPQPTGDQIGTVLAECTVVTVGEEDAPEDTSVLCSRMFTLDGRGDIAAAESYTFADPLSDTIPITGGTGKFRTAGGEIDFDLQDVEDNPDIVNSIYTIRLLRLQPKR